MYQDESQNKNQKIATAFIAILVVVIIAAVTTKLTSNSAASVSTMPGTASTVAANPSDTMSTNTMNTNMAQASYKDGTYTATSAYDTPGGQESISVSVTLQNGTVTKSGVQNQANNRDSREYQNAFTSDYKSFVIGKHINDISLSRISGSSLTSSGFNDALDEIRNQSKV